VSVYNSRAHTRIVPIVIHVNEMKVKVLDTSRDDAEVAAQISPVFSYNAKSGVQKDNFEVVCLF
jgi:hypothetical protein